MNIESFEKGIRLPFRRTMIASLLGAGLLTAAAAQAQERAGNPFVGASSYLNPDYTKDVNFSISKVSDSALKQKMKIVAGYPTFV
jgi:cellulose 1,4-beta-cellobiosidase